MTGNKIEAIASRLRLVVGLQALVWRQRNLTWSHRVSFAATSMIAPLLGSVLYCGRRFYSDNSLALLLLPDYVKLCDEVHVMVKSDGGDLQRLLDIGANVGQFAATMSRLFDVEIHSVEPNPMCWPYLIRNGCDTDRWHLHRRAISEHIGVKSLWFVPGRSAQGSFFAVNAVADLLGDPEACSVEVQTSPLIDGTDDSLSDFDLVKIDVEGFELEVIRGLRGLTARYLLIEIDETRANGFTLDELQETVSLELGYQLDAIYCDKTNWDNGPRNMLFRLSKTSAS